MGGISAVSLSAPPRQSLGENEKKKPKNQSPGPTGMDFTTALPERACQVTRSCHLDYAMAFCPTRSVLRKEALSWLGKGRHGNSGEGAMLKPWRESHPSVARGE